MMISLKLGTRDKNDKKILPVGSGIKKLYLRKAKERFAFFQSAIIGPALIIG